MSRIEGHKNLVRDDKNMAIINTDKNAYNNAKALKAKNIKQTSEINTLKDEINDMKELLLQINEKMKWQEQ